MAAEGGTRPSGQGVDARCPRCGCAFHCGIDEPQPCACTTLRLDAATLADLRQRYRGCLCVACLSELAAQEDGPPSAAAPRRPAAATNAIDRALDAVAASLAPLAIAITALLFLQWPLRDIVHAGSTLANDVAQWLFAWYVAIAIREATRHGEHLTARGDLAPRCNPTAPQRSRWRAIGAALCLLPWALYLLAASWPTVTQAVIGRERFPETDNPGYFMTHLALALLALLAVWQGARDLWRALRPPPPR